MLRRVFYTIRSMSQPIEPSLAFIRFGMPLLGADWIFCLLRIQATSKSLLGFLGKGGSGEHQGIYIYS
jgi:hypothetical protein